MPTAGSFSTPRAYQTYQAKCFCVPVLFLKHMLLAFCSTHWWNSFIHHRDVFGLSLVTRYKCIGETEKTNLCTTLSCPNTNHLTTQGKLRSKNQSFHFDFSPSSTGIIIQAPPNPNNPLVYKH